MRYPLEFEWLRRAQPSPTPVNAAPVKATPAGAPRRSELSRMLGNEPLDDARFSLRDRQQLAARLSPGEHHLFRGLLVPEDGPVADFDIDGERRGSIASAQAPAQAPAASSVSGAGSGLGAAVDAVLMGSSQGRFALATLKKHKVTLLPAPGNFPQFTPGSNECKLDTTMSPEVSAAYFIHEMYHAHMHHTRQSLDAATMADTPEERDRFVDQHVSEEIVGTLQGLEGVLAYTPTGTIQDEPAKRSVPCYSDYVSAFNYNFQTQVSAGKTRAAAEKVAHKLARSAVWIYMDDPARMRIKYRPFGGALTYRQHYRREWDRIQAQRRATP